MSYDIRGNKTGMVDPDMGTWSYTYNALGQLVTQTDAELQVTKKAYDDLGRITEEYYGWVTDTNYQTKHEFYYDGSGEFQQIGKLHLEKTLDSAQTEAFRRSHYYDDLGRAFLTLTKTGGRWFYQQTDYDSYSRPVRLTHYWRPPEIADAHNPANDKYLAWYSYSQETLYDSRSFVTTVQDANGQTWFSMPDYNEHGQLESYIAGGTITTETDYDDATHLVERIHTKTGGTGLLEQTFAFDSLGNFTERKKKTGTGNWLEEDFTYDNLNRALTAVVAGGETLTMTYDDFGNIQTRNSSNTVDGLGHVAGNYTYFADTNRVNLAGNRDFDYDDNGSIIEIDTGGNKGVITWTAFNKPLALATNDQKRSLFSYDSANSRVLQTRQEWDSGQGTWLDKTRKTYIGALFEQEQSWDLSGTDWEIASTRIYISTPAGVIGSWVDDESQINPTLTVFHRDHLGSVVAHSDLAASPAEITREFSFDAWGLRRDATDWTGAYTASSTDLSATDRGYTGHEMLDELGLVHMNGRIYDSLLGRMLSADPHIQSPTNLQNYNRYSYVLNNPLSMTDPSGFFFKKLFKSIAKFFKKFWRPLVAIALAAVIMFVIGPAIFNVANFAALSTQQAFATTVLAGAASGAVTGGVRGALFGAIGAAAFFGVGQYFKGAMEFLSPKHLAKIVAHGVTGGTLSEVQGGDFLDGFISAAVVQFAAPGIDGLDHAYERVTAAAVLGGAVSEATGGSFENGAVTGAFSRLFNDEAHAVGEYLEGVSDTWYGYLSGVARGASFGLIDLPV
ncbi:MAG: RHS repeat-associated core domain-containing protein, partial [Verrucomicrobiota bacterium]